MGEKKNMKTLFEPNCWNGSFYELSIQLSSSPNIDRIKQVLNAIYNGNNIK